MFNISYNNKTSNNFPAYIVKRPNIPTAEEKYKAFSVKGRNGDLIIKEGTYKDISIPIEFTYVASPSMWMETFRELKGWLLGTEDNRLIFSDDQGFFYKVKRVTIGTNKREYKKIGTFTVTFVCEGCQYSVDGTEYKDLNEMKYNPYNTSHPEIRIEGEGVCTLNVNNNTFTANVGQNITIDTERMISYKDNGTLQNSLVNGDYEGLYLLSGENTIEATEGFTVTIKPNWKVI